MNNSLLCASFTYSSE